MVGGSASGSTGAAGASAAASAALRDLGAGAPVSPAAGSGREDAPLEAAPAVGSGVFVGVMSAGS